MQQQQPKMNPRGDLFTFLLGALIAAFFVVGNILITKVLWPIVKWAAIKAWNKIRGKSATKEAEEPMGVQEPEQDVRPDVGNGLPVPDIFKDSPNLARLREFKF